MKKYASVSVLKRHLLVLLGLALAGSPAVGVAQDASQVEELSGESLENTEESQWWTPWYLVDYGIIAAGTTALAIGEQMEPTPAALIGPAYSETDPASFYKHPEIDAVSRPYRPEGNGETVPKEWGIGAIGAAALSLGALEGYRWAQGTGSAQHFHDTLIGGSGYRAGVRKLRLLAPLWARRTSSRAQPGLQAGHERIGRARPVAARGGRAAHRAPWRLLKFS